MKWIGITGRAGAGKDHLFQQLAKYTPDVRRLSFADVLRDEIEISIGHKITKPYTELERKLQQWWGTDYRRANDPDYWVRRAELQANGVEVQGYIPVFTDVRFHNEADMIRRHGGLIVRVMAPPEVRQDRLGVLPPEHASETAMDDYEADMHITSTEDNPAYDGQVRAIVVESTFEESEFLKAISDSLASRG
jgi:hypothetical protein